MAIGDVRKIIVFLSCTVVISCRAYGQDHGADVTIISRQDIGRFSFSVQSISNSRTKNDSPPNRNGSLYWVDALDNDTGETRRVWQRQFGVLFPHGRKPDGFMIAQQSASKFAVAYCVGLFSVHVEEFSALEELVLSTADDNNENTGVKCIPSNFREGFFATHVLTERLGAREMKFGIFPPTISTFRFADNSWQVTLSTNLKAKTASDDSEITYYRFQRKIGEDKWKSIGPVITERGKVSDTELAD